MLAAIKDYGRRLFQSWVGRMSGPASIILAVLAAFWPSNDSGKQYLFMAASVCFVMASFAVWFQERKERLRLEQESGPQVFIEISKPGVWDAVTFVNKGTEPALNVELEEEQVPEINLHVIPWTIPIVDLNTPQSIKLLSYKQISETGGHIRPLVEFLAGKEEGMQLGVLFDNMKGTRFRRRFRLLRPLMSNEVYCYPIGSREVLKKDTAKEVTGQC